MMKLLYRLFGRFGLYLPARVRHTFAIELLAGVFIAIGSGCFGPYHALIARQDFHAGQFLIGIMTAGCAVGAMCCLFTAGIVPRGREKAAYVISNSVARLLIIVMAFCHAAPVFCWMAFFINLFTTVPGPQYNIMMTRLYPIDLRGRLMGLARLNVSLVGLLTVFLSGRYMHAGGSWRTVFIVGGAAYVTGTLLYLLWRVPAPDAGEQALSPLASVRSAMSLVREKLHLYLTLLLTITSVSACVQNIILPIYQADVLKITPAQLSILSVISTGTAMAGYLFWGRLIDKTGAPAVFGLATLTALVLPVNYFFAPGYLWLIPGCFFSGLSASGTELGWLTTLMEIAGRGNERRVQTFHAFWGGIRILIGIALGVYLIGFIDRMHIDLRYVFVIVIVLMLSGAVPLMIVTGRYNKSRTKTGEDKGR
ncbi:MAG: MFS transporter [Abditibacteriota bacterium]|nr:MFS transporter [Abditibacteriota bacterium]